jgi:hypothetical protein
MPFASHSIIHSDKSSLEQFCHSSDWSAWRQLKGLGGAVHFKGRRKKQFAAGNADSTTTSGVAKQKGCSSHTVDDDDEEDEEDADGEQHLSPCSAVQRRAAPCTAAAAERRKNKSETCLCFPAIQGDQIWRIFALWPIVFLCAASFKITQVAESEG